MELRYSFPTKPNHSSPASHTGPYAPTSLFQKREKVDGASKLISMRLISRQVLFLFRRISRCIPFLPAAFERVHLFETFTQ
jgi:hypothetical protein